MKKLALTLTVTLACVAAFGQGKVRFVNDSLHLVYFTTDTGSLLTADKASAGLTTPVGGLTLSGQTLSADLFGGATAGTMTKQGTVAFSAAADGTLNALNIVSTLPGGTAAFFQVQVYDTAMGSYANAAASLGHYYGETAVFNVTPNGGTQYASIVQSGSIAFSTWAAGTQAENGSAYGAGSMGALAIQANVPEPTSLALLGLGAASLMIFRRRK